ncbi:MULTISPECIES: hypothetical protein [Hyphomicrobium]|jgi:hypothetical protein|uniref:hypothetical protein n=1 Tax=Hyphomicrobium TaxID=81 RepID=UPI0003637556|nr:MULTISPECIES: hypothetical protein [Hyphomicrobium]WBT38773.1 hypothetical protein PE058_02540 [Hyphomicrobium sp. DMF-1]
MIVSASAYPLTALILPLLTSGAAWAIAVWALKQGGARIDFLRKMKPPTGAGGYPPRATPPERIRTDNTKEREDQS